MLKRLLSAIFVLLIATVVMAADKKFTLVIDAGHGGHDAGAVGATSQEKNINLRVALAFGQYVERNCPDVRVIYTRKTDVFVPLQGRADIANKAKADLFVSVHTNSVAGSKTAKGFEVYTLGMHRASDNLDVAKRENSVITLESDYQSKYQGFDPNSAESYIMFEYMQDKNMENSVKLAKLVETNVCQSASRLNKGVHQAGFLVLRETSMPSCLIELGFISTPEEEQQLNDPIIQDLVARGIYQAFQKYRGKSSNVDVVTPNVTTPKNDTVQIEETPKAEKTIHRETTKPDAPSPKVVKKETAMKENTNAGIIFKVQILASAKVLKTSDSQFKGMTGIDSYQENGMHKYTYGASSNYNEIYNLRKQILDKFPEAFIIAFKNGEKTNVNAAIKEWKANK